MTRLGRLVTVPIPLLLLLDLVSWTNPWVYPAMAVGVAGQLDAERTIRAWTRRPSVERLARGRFTVGLATAAIVGGVLCLGGMWSTTLAWALIVQAGVVARLAKGPGDQILVGATVAVAVALPVGLWADGSGALFMFATLTACTISVAIGVLVRTHEQRLADTTELMRTQERARMAADLHDLVAHEVTGIVVLAQAAGASTSDPGAADNFARIERSAHEALNEIRLLVAQNDDDIPTAPGHGVSALRDVADRFAATTPARVDIDMVLADHEQIPGVAASVLLRTLTESLTNVRRHAHPSTVLVRLDHGDEGAGLRLLIRNDGLDSGGVGSGNGSGLARARDRAALIGGTLRAGPTGEGYWETELRLPPGAL